MVRRILCVTFLLAMAAVFAACGRNEAGKTAAGKAVSDTTAKIVFVELGSVSCIPCKKMQPIMKSIESRYAGQVKVVFHDVLNDRAIGQQYGIKLIPTQVFLDASGKELMRHEGFFAEEEIDKFLKSNGLTLAS